MYTKGISRSRAEEREARQSARLFSWGRFLIQSARLESRRVDVSLACADGHCRITRPLEGPADPEAAGALLDNVAGLSLAVELARGEAAEAQLAEYGLSPAPLTFTATTTDGRRHRLYVGERRAVDGRRIVAGGEPLRLGVADETFYWALDRDLFELRAKQLLSVSKDAIGAVRIERAGVPPRALTLARGKEGWTVEAEGRTLPADPYVVDQLLLLLARNLKADAYLTDAYGPADAARFGLDHPAITLRIEAGERTILARVGVAPRPEGAGDPSEIGKPAPFVHVEGSSSVAVVYGALLEDLDKGLADFRDRRLSDGDLEAVRRIEILREGLPRVILEGAGDAWRMLEPEAVKARPDRAKAIALQFARLRAAKVVDEDVSEARLASLGLSPPELRLRMLGEAGAVIADVAFGKSADKDHVYARAAGVARVDLVKNATLRLLAPKLEEYIAR